MIGLMCVIEQMVRDERVQLLDILDGMKRMLCYSRWFLNLIMTIIQDDIRKVCGNSSESDVKWSCSLRKYGEAWSPKVVTCIGVFMKAP